MNAKTQRLDNWDDLRFFLAVARRGGLSAASRELSVNQSTVSRRIQQLEEQLDARLFDRQARGYALTAVGEEMLALAAVVEDDVLALQRAVLGADRALRGTVRVTTLDEVFERIAPHLRCFRERYPGIALEVSSELRMYSLSRREADVAIRPALRPDEDRIVGRKLVALPVAAYASPSYLRSRTRPRTRDELGGHELIGFGDDRQGIRMQQELAADVPISLRTNSVSGQAIAARAGLGIALLPRFVGDAEPGLERLFTITLQSKAHLWLLIHADLRQTARVRAFIDFMTEAILGDRALYEGAD